MIMTLSVLFAPRDCRSNLAGGMVSPPPLDLTQSNHTTEPGAARRLRESSLRGPRPGASAPIETPWRAETVASAKKGRAFKLGSPFTLAPSFTRKLIF